MCFQHPLLEEQDKDSMVPELAVPPQTCLVSDHGPQGLVGQAGDEVPQALDLATPASDSALKVLAECSQTSDSDPQAMERPVETAAMAPHTSDLMPQETVLAAESQESLQKAVHGDPLQTSTSGAPLQCPEIQIQAQLLVGGETGESEAEAQELRQEVPESKPGPSEPSLCVQLEEQETLGQRLDLPKRQTEARGHEQRLEGMIGDPAQQKPQQTPEGTPETQVSEETIPGKTLARGAPEQEALREEVVWLRREAEVLRAELEAQARRLEARGLEVARLSEELAQAQKAEAEAHQEVEAQVREQARLQEAVEAAGRELEAASREREALAEALAATGRERRQWEREGLRLQARAEAAEERLQGLESEGHQHLEVAERERQEKQALKEVCGHPRPGSGNGV